MGDRVALYIRGQPIDDEFIGRLRRQVEVAGDQVAAVFADDGKRCRRQRGPWQILLASLETVDLIALPSAIDLPARSQRDLLAILGRLRDRRVGLWLMADAIDTRSGSPFVVLDVLEAFRKSRLSAAIRRGQAIALAAGKSISRPAIPTLVEAGVRQSLWEGAGVRAIARQFGISAGSVINIRRGVGTRSPGDCASASASTDIGLRAG